jgi:hypothetical protein
MSVGNQKRGNLAKWGTAALVGFLAFAPPGTMIVIGLFLLWLLQDHWMVAVPIIVLLALLSAFAFVRYRRGRNTEVGH